MKKNFALVWFAALVMIQGNACNSATPSPATSAAPVAASTNSSLSKEEAEKIIQQMATQSGCKDSTAEMRLSFTDADGKPQQMDFRLQRKYEGSKVSTLMTVLAPKEESEKALLAFEEAGKPTDAISYLAGLKKTAHLKSDNPLNFRGSKSTVQEMLGMELGQYEVVAVTGSSKNAEDGQWEIELKAKDGMTLAFPKIKLVASANAPGWPQKIELFDAQGEKLKTIQATAMGPQQKYPTIIKLEIEDHKRNQKLRLETRRIKYDTNLPSSLFTEAQLIKVVTAASQKAIQ